MRAYSKSTAGHEFLPWVRVFFAEPFRVAFRHVLLTRQHHPPCTMMFRVQYRVKGVVPRQGAARCFGCKNSMKQMGDIFKHFSWTQMTNKLSRCLKSKVSNGTIDYWKIRKNTGFLVLLKDGRDGKCSNKRPWRVEDILKASWAHETCLLWYYSATGSSVLTCHRSQWQSECITLHIISNND